VAFQRIVRRFALPAPVRSPHLLRSTFNSRHAPCDRCPGNLGVGICARRPSFWRIGAGIFIREDRLFLASTSCPLEAEIQRR
jgi:hypothetical protein